MPRLGESVEEGTIGRWLKAIGDRVEKDEPLVEIITDKVNVEVPSPAAGLLTSIVVDEGQSAKTGAVLAVLDGEQGAGALRVRAARAEPDSPTMSQPSAVVAAPPANAATEVDDAAARTSPLVRRLAREHGIDLAAIAGTGLGGRVTREDVEAAIAARTQSPTIPAVPQAAEPPPVAVAEGTKLADWAALTPMRRAIAEHMTRSATTVPRVTICYEIDVTGIARLRERGQAGFREREGFELTYAPFMGAAAAACLREFPILNARYEESNGRPGIRARAEINLGIAVGLDDGLIVPVIRGADGLSIAGMARAIRSLATRARSKALAPDDVRGGTFTLNNTGAFGAISSQPIINEGQAAILTMEAVARRPVVIGGPDGESIAIRSMMGSCLTFDHRILDGLQAGRFMQALKKRLEAYGPETTLQ
ncbi:MAG: 2-oxo acid dehydrogenase subunit E2 [Chloroflexota bacterium]|nr:MAG: 2-oxo acid dehydrogenase subunit E2 [Chloroflexota bacterium]